MQSASWATLTLGGVDELGRQLQITQRCVVVTYADRRALLVPWWPQWAMRVGGWSTSPN